MISSESRKHVAVLPFPFTSHPAALAKIVLRLAAVAPSVHFSFFNVPNSNSLIFPAASNSTHNHLPTNFKIYDIAAPAGQNYQTQAESYFNSAPQIYESAIEGAVADIGVPVTCLLADVMIACAIDISRKMRVKWIAVWIAAPYSLLVPVQAQVIIDYIRLHGGFDEVRKHKVDFIPGLSMFKMEDLHDTIVQGGKGNMKSMARILALGSKLANATAVVLNCFEEVTLAETVAALGSILQTPVLQIGCPDDILLGERLLDDNSDQTGGCLSWLDQQSPRSVVYVSFGNTSLLPPDEISAIAEALEERKTPFVWSLKDRIHLPVGFIERTRSYGKLVAWAPQTLVLSHPSVGAHLMHAGFNSMVESVFAEVPMICRPLWAENPMNAQMVNNVWRIGVGVDEAGVITKDGLVKCLEMVLGDHGEQGKMMRERIKSLKEVMVQAGSATKYFNSLLHLVST